MRRRHWDASAWQELGEVDSSTTESEMNGTIIALVWPGGYPVVYVDPEDESEGLCATTVREMIKAGEWPEGRTVDSYTHYEGAPVECSCGAMIASAYGDPEEESDAS